jgi:FdhD protein
MSLGPVPGLGYAGPARTHDAVELADGVARAIAATVAEEVPVAFVYNGRSHVVVMATPDALEELALGFSLSERIVAHAAEVERVEVVRHSRGVELQLTVPPAVAEALEGRRRGMSARTGCGLCGVDAIDEALRDVPRVVGAGPVTAGALAAAGRALADNQPLNADTRAVHAAALADADGRLLVVREDVGRHNALDKVIGAMSRSGVDPRGGFLVVTSRASYELVQKTAVAGVPLLAAVSRPTSLAIRLAESAGITLVGLLRGSGAVVYAGSGVAGVR